MFSKKYRIKQDLVVGVGEIVWIVEEKILFWWVYVPGTISFTLNECKERLRVIQNPVIFDVGKENNNETYS